MLTDLRELPDGTLFDCDICIIGGGAAGITVASALAGDRLKVVLLESGGLEIDADVQALYEGENIGRPYFPLDASRLRFFGGTTNHWMGQSFPLDEIDFRARAWVPHSGWPIARAELEPFWPRAAALCDLGSFDFGAAQLQGTPFAPDDFLPEKIILRYYRISTPTTRFGEKFREPLRSAPNIDVVLHATVATLATNATASQVTHAEISDVSGKRAIARARLYVLACGGIENARLLLLSDQVNPKGLANGNDLVGRYFMEHPNVHVGDLEAHDARGVADRYDTIALGGSRLSHQFWLPPEHQEREGLLNAAAELLVFLAEDPSSVGRLKRLLNSVRRGRLPDDMAAELWNLISQMDEIGGAVARRLWNGEWPAPAAVPLSVALEPAPDPDSRVTLSDDVDALGLRRVRLDWRLGEQELRTARALALRVGMEAGRLRLGRLRLDEALAAPTPTWPEQVEGGYHHMGTTRMSANPATGVVDGDCRCHEVPNLFIAGSSVFPTAGFTNPTLNIVALALRLADHLRDAARS